MKKVTNGLLIVIEGIDGSGKTSLVQNLKKSLEPEYPILTTKEPGATELGKAIRPLLQEQNIAVCPKAEFLLFAADRAQHFETVILPELANGKVIISDRMGDSSLCYQGYGRGLGIEEIKSVNKWATNNRNPDLTLFVDVDIEEAFKRINHRNDSLTAFEKRELIKKVQQGFYTIYKNRTDVVTINGNLSQEDILSQSLLEIKKLIQKQ